MQAPMSSPPESLSQFVERLTAAQSPLYGCIQILLAGAPEAADVLQETNKVLWQKAAEYDPSRPFLPWAYSIARFQVLAQRKRLSRDRLVFDDALLEQLSDAVSQQTADGERQLRALESCLQQLPAAQRDLLDARYQGGESVNDIAARQGKPANAISALLYRVRSALADCIERRLAQEECA